MQEVQHCQDVRVPAAVQEEVVQLIHRDRCGRVGDSRVVSVWRFHHDARHAPITEGDVRRIVLHDQFLCGLRGSLAHESLHRILLCVRLTTIKEMGSVRNLPAAPAPAREPVITIPPSSGAAPAFEPKDWP